MQITDEARDDLQRLIQENNAHGLRVVLEQTCCSKVPVVGLDLFNGEDAPVDINTIPVVFTDIPKEAAESLVLDKVDGQLVLMDTAEKEQDCSCCAGGDGCCHGNS